MTFLKTFFIIFFTNISHFKSIKNDEFEFQSKFFQYLFLNFINILFKM